MTRKQDRLDVRREMQDVRCTWDARRTSRRKHAPILPNGMPILQGTINHRTSALRIRPGQPKRAPNVSSAATHPSICDVHGMSGTELERPLEQPGVPAAFQQEAPEPFRQCWNAAGAPLERRAERRAVPAGGSIDPMEPCWNSSSQRREELTGHAIEQRLTLVLYESALWPKQSLMKLVMQYLSAQAPSQYVRR